ncbi:MAG: hypothetical protein RIQ90_1065 [Bacteroidota bacterium]|jgi:hypothetical protein
MKIFTITLLLVICGFSQAQTVEFAVTPRVGQPLLPNEKEDLKAKKFKENNNVVTLKNTSGIKGWHRWRIGNDTVPGKNWELISKTKSGDEIKVAFNKVGNYSVTLTVFNSKGSGDDKEEFEFEGEMEDAITIRNVYPELAAIYAQKPRPDYVKLIKKSDEYRIKEKYRTDPTPNLFMAKGYFGIFKDGKVEEEIENPFEDAISAFATAKELDLNGIIQDDEHQVFLNELEKAIFSDHIEVQIAVSENEFDPTTLKISAEDMEDLMMHMDYYSQVSYFPLAVNLLQACIEQYKNNKKGAKALWDAAIPLLSKYKKLDEETPFGAKFIDENGKTLIASPEDMKALKYGLMWTSYLKSMGEEKASICKSFLRNTAPWFIDDKNFRDYYEAQFTKCVE